MSIPELLSAIKLLCMRFQTALVTVVDDLRLDTLLRMLKTPHFSTKMNSLKEVRGQGLQCQELEVKPLSLLLCYCPCGRFLLYKLYKMCLCV